MEHDQNTQVFLTEREGKPLWILQGVIDIFSAEQLHNLALQLIERDADVVVDCGKVEQVGSAICQILFALKDGRRAKGKQLCFQGVSPAVMKQLDLGGLTKVLLSEETEI